MSADAQLFSIQQDGGASDDPYIVLLRDGIDPNGVAAAVGITPKCILVNIGGFAATLNGDQLAALRQIPDVEFIEQI